MPQSIQIVPKYRYPHIEVYVNDYTEVADTTVTTEEDTTVKFLFAIHAPSGIDNRWIKKTTRSSAEATFGKSDLKTYGQPYSQALAVLDRENSSVWLMRVMPENATYANAIVSAYFKADSADDYEEAHKRKFRIKFTSKSLEGATKDSAIKEYATTLDGAYGRDDDGNLVYRDAEGYLQVPGIFTFYSSGRGKYGNVQSVRFSQALTYEKEYGVKMYNYEVLKNEDGLNLIATYVAAAVTSDKYPDAIPTLVDDVLGRYVKGSYPVEISANEENIEKIYDAYIEFATALHADLTAEYNEKYVEYNLPEDVLSGITPATGDQIEMLATLNEIEELEDATAPENLPSIDEFDIVFGNKVGSSSKLPGIAYPEELTSDIDITAEDFDANDYTESDIINFGSTKGIVLSNGSDGYFDTPSKTVDSEGNEVSRTFEDELEICYNNAFNGTYDKRVLSKARIPVTCYFDANYPFSVKETLCELRDLRDDGPVYLDAGIIDSLSVSSRVSLASKYAAFTDRAQSIDIQHYQVRDTYSKKKYDVTASFFNAPRLVELVTDEGIHVPLANENCILSDYVTESLAPAVEEWETDTMEWLNDNRFNYYLCTNENEFRRWTQNTRQSAISDLLEENNIRTLYMMKRVLETEALSQIYNFADESIREDFVRYVRAKYANWNGVECESFNLNFATSEYEFNHSILHLYLQVVFRGLTKYVTIEIDINKRTYGSDEVEATE